MTRFENLIKMIKDKNHPDTIYKEAQYLRCEKVISSNEFTIIKSFLSSN